MQQFGSITQLSERSRSVGDPTNFDGNTVRPVGWIRVRICHIDQSYKGNVLRVGGMDTGAFAPCWYISSYLDFFEMNNLAFMGVSGKLSDVASN